MSAGHTPGPWLVQADQDGDYVIWTRQPHTGTLASVCVEDINGEFPARANATLMAAAPELLEACKTNRIALIAIADSAVEAGFDQLADIIDEQLGKCNAAIAKATGQ